MTDHCVCKLDESGNIVSLCMEHKTMLDERDKRIAELEAALRPFAEAWRTYEQNPRLEIEPTVPDEAFARSAGLLKPEKG
jgi:hypothetical protein